MLLLQGPRADFRRRTSRGKTNDQNTKKNIENPASATLDERVSQLSNSDIRRNSRGDSAQLRRTLPTQL